MTLRRMIDCEDFLIIYKTYTRPHLEYAIQSWSPYLQKDIRCLKNVQRAATRLISGFKKLSYEEKLRAAGLTTLEVRRQRGDLIEGIDRKGEYRPALVLPSFRQYTWSSQPQSQVIAWQMPSWPQEKFLQPKSHQCMEQSSSTCRQCRNWLDAHWKTTGCGQ